MQRSRRLLFVLSPEFFAEKSFSLLECRLGLYLEHTHKATIVGVVYRSISKLPVAEVVQVRRAAVTMVTWRRKRSESPRSRFWLRLRLALPVRPLALGRRMIDSTSSHSDLAAFVLQKHYREAANQSRGHRRASASQSRASRRASANQSLHRERQFTETRRTCFGCAGVAIETQQPHDRVEAMSEPVNQTGRTPLTEATNEMLFSPGSNPLPDSEVAIETEQSHDQSGFRSDPAPFTPDSSHEYNASSTESPFAILTNFTQDLSGQDPDPTLSSDSAPFTDSAPGSALSMYQQEAEETQKTNTAA